MEDSFNRECIERMLTEMASQVRQSTTDNIVAVSLHSGAAALDAFAER
jgi:hypothetical protein